MRLKKLVIGILCAAMTAALLTGCKTAETEDNASAGASGKIELEFFVQKREASDTFAKVIDSFNQSQDEIVVKQNIVPDGNTVLLSRASTDDLPDIIQVGGLQDSNTMQFMKEGYFLDISNEECLKGVSANYKDSLMYNGSIYVMPISANFSGVFYNKELFDAAGYEIPKTYDALIEIAGDIQAKGEIPFLFPDKDSWTIVQCWEDNIQGSSLKSRGELYRSILDGSNTFETDPLTLECLQKVIDIRKYGQGNTLALGYDQAISDFATGGSYMFMQGIWALPSIKSANPEMKIGMFSFPAADGQDPIVSMGIDVNIAISSNCKHPEAAKKFLNFIGSKEMVQLYVDNDYSLPCIDGVNANIPEAQTIVDAVAGGSGVLQTLALPKATSDLRANTIQSIILESGATPAVDYLKTLTQSFLENKEEYLSMYGE